ncbi:MAG TPA: hypothetical protein V6D22_24375 [Candidatus Obscuribacterales bacterium]
MDYLPPEKPAVIAKADQKLMAARHEASYAFVDLGTIRALPEPEDWDSTQTYEQQLGLHKLTPGQRVIFAKPDSAVQPVWYIDQHKPCSPAAFDAFTKLVNGNTAQILGQPQLQPLKDILGSKATDKTFDIQADVTERGGRKVLNILYSRHGAKTFGHALYLVADTKKRLIQEVGYEGANFGKDHWSEEAQQMLANIKFKPEK